MNNMDSTERQQLGRDKAHNARQFRAQARSQLTDIVENMTTQEFVDAVLGDEIAMLSFVPEGVK